VLFFARGFQETNPRINPSGTCHKQIVLVIVGIIPFSIVLVMFAIETSPSRSESSPTSNTDDTSSSTQSVNTVFYDFVDFQPPKGFRTDLSRVKNDESPSPHQ